MERCCGSMSFGLPRAPTGSCDGVDELVQREVAGVHLADVFLICTAVHGRKTGPLGPGLSLGPDVVSVVLQIAGRAHGGNFFHRADMSAQLLAQASNGRRVE